MVPKVNDSSSILIDFSNSNLSYVSIQAKYGDLVVVGTKSWIAPLHKPIVYNGLQPDMCYNFIVTPYNHASVGGNQVSTFTNIYTFSYVYNLKSTVNDSSSITIDFSNSDISFVTIQSITSNNQNNDYYLSKIYYNPLIKPIIYRGLQPDICYNFIVTPYNHANVKGFSVVTNIPVYTLSRINSVSLSTSYDTLNEIQYINISIDDCSDFSYVTISENKNPSDNLLIYNKPIDLKDTIVIKFLPQGNFNYKFILIPYNHSNIAGNSYETGFIST